MLYIGEDMKKLLLTANILVACSTMVVNAMQGELPLPYSLRNNASNVYANQTQFVKQEPVIHNPLQHNMYIEEAQNRKITAPIMNNLISAVTGAAERYIIENLNNIRNMGAFPFIDFYNNKVIPLLKSAAGGQNNFNEAFLLGNLYLISNFADICYNKLHRITTGYSQREQILLHIGNFQYFLDEARNIPQLQIMIANAFSFAEEDFFLKEGFFLGERYNTAVAEEIIKHDLYRLCKIYTAQKSITMFNMLFSGAQNNIKVNLATLWRVDQNGHIVSNKETNPVNFIELFSTQHGNIADINPEDFLCLYHISGAATRYNSLALTIRQLFCRFQDLNLFVQFARNDLAKARCRYFFIENMVVFMCVLQREFPNIVANISEHKGIRYAIKFFVRDLENNTRTECSIRSLLSIVEKHIRDSNLYINVIQNDIKNLTDLIDRVNSGLGLTGNTIDNIIALPGYCAKHGKSVDQCFELLKSMKDEDLVTANHEASLYDIQSFVDYLMTNKRWDSYLK